MKKYIRMIGFMLLYILLYFGIFKTVQFLWGGLGESSAAGNWVSDNPLGIVILNDVLALPIFSVLIYLVKKQSILKISLFRKTNPQNILASVIIGICMGIFVVNFFQLEFCKNIPIFETLLDYIYNSSSMLVFIGFVVIGTFFKEILFRGLVFNEMRNTIPLVLAIVVHAVIYGALFFNFDIPLTIFGTLGNIVVVLTYVLSGSIWACYTAQVANNICIYAIRNYTGDFFGNSRLLPIVASAVVICASLVWMYFLKNRTDKQVQKAAL